MRQNIIFIIIVLIVGLSDAQNQFHVFPKNHKTTPGKSSGNGSSIQPWDLQTALTQKLNVVNGGDTIWLHEGVYNGNFTSLLASKIEGEHITVAAFNNDKVVLNGNINSKLNAVLTVKGTQVIFKDFEVTFLGDYSRFEGDQNFKVSTGINHVSGEDCKFINLKIYDIPGLGFGSWKRTGGSTIENCIIYNNGYVSKGKKGRGEGIYVQNASDKERIIKNNIIFNNYYKGVEVWSASKRAKEAFVKNVTLKNNVIFNSGSPSGLIKDNIIVASNDRNGVNIAKNIKVLDNILYHNTNILKEEIRGDAASLTLGFYHNAPVENIIVENNIVIGRNNAMRILHAKSLIFRNNTIFSGQVHFNKSVVKHLNSENWKFNNNKYYTKSDKLFRVIKYKAYNLDDWSNTFDFDKGSKRSSLKEFNLNKVLNITKNEYKPNSFRVVLFNKQGKDVEVDFSKHKLRKGTRYKIIDVENRNEVLKFGKLGKSEKVTFPMNSTKIEMPLHNTKAKKTLNNFGIYIIEFEHKKRKTFFGKLFESIF